MFNNLRKMSIKTDLKRKKLKFVEQNRPFWLFSASVLALLSIFDVFCVVLGPFFNHRSISVGENKNFKKSHQHITHENQNLYTTLMLLTDSARLLHISNNNNNNYQGHSQQNETTTKHIFLRRSATARILLLLR